MSLTTWKKQFYPKKPSSRMSWITATEHSLKKWMGALPGNVKKHGVEYKSHHIVHKKQYNLRMSFSYLTCALCVKSMSIKIKDHIYCSVCPLQKMLGRSCDEYGVASIYEQSTNNPTAMILTLQKLLKKLKNKEIKGGKR